MDNAGNPIVDIETTSVPKFPEEGEDKFSPAQKAAIQFLSRGGQPNVVALLDKMKVELEEVLTRFNDIQFEGLPLDIELNRLQTKDVHAMIEEVRGSFL